MKPAFTGVQVQFHFILKYKLPIYAEEKWWSGNIKNTRLKKCDLKKDRLRHWHMHISGPEQIWNSFCLGGF